MIAALRKYRSLPGDDRDLLLEAGVLLVLVRVGLVVPRYRAVRRLLERYAATHRLPRAARSPGPADALPRRVAWAIGALSARAPGPTTCLAQALVADALLSRRGYPSRLRFGVQHRAADAAGPLLAHAWVECNGVVVVGDVENLAAYAPLIEPERS